MIAMNVLIRKTPEPGEAPNLFRRPVDDFVKQRHTIGLCPQSDLSRIRESGVFDFEQLSAVVEDAKAAGFELHAEGKPLIGWDRNCDPVASLPADDVSALRTPSMVL